MFKGIWALLSLSFIFPWNRKPWLDNFMFIVTLECAICEYEHTSLKIISRGPNNGSTCIWEKYFIIVWGECDTLLKQMELQFSSFSLISVRDSAKKSQRNKNLEASCNLLNNWIHMTRVTSPLETTVCPLEMVLVWVSLPAGEVGKKREGHFKTTHFIKSSYS